jgi:hypothetical protein
MEKSIGPILTVCLIALAACAQPGPRVSLAQVPPAKSGSARVWFLRQSTSHWPAVQAFSPMIYTNGAPVAAIPTETAFYRDFAPGTYRFTVQTFELPTSQATSLQLASGTEYFLDVDWIDRGINWAGSFAVLPMGTQLAQAYLPTLHYPGEE